MQRLIRNFLWMVLLLAGLQMVWAFSLIGPVGNGDDAYQQSLIGYNPISGKGPPYFLEGQPSGPKKIGEGYRRNTPVMYYASDATFIKFVGSNGLVEVDKAYAILNSLTNVDNYSAGLSEFPLQTVQEAYSQEALLMEDLKSSILPNMLEQMGLSDAIRYTWALHGRFPIPNENCPDMLYTVIMRNLDITANPLNQIQYSPYVNGVLWDYRIQELCSGVPPNLSDAVEFSADPLAMYPPVASGRGEIALLPGTFFTGLTRDDVAGLRSLMSSNNVNTELPALGSLLEDTNNPSTLVTTSDLGALLTSGQTNDPATLAVLFPGVVASSTSYFTNILVANVVTFTTNYVGEPYGTPPHIITITNGFTVTTVQRFLTTFANVVTNSYRTNSTAKILTTTFGAQVGAPYGSPFVTTPSTKTINLTNTPTGDYFIIPAGTCGLNVVHVWQTNVISTTNLIAFAINPDGSSVTESLVTSYTNHVLEVRPCNFVTPTPRLYEGVQRIQFVRANFDSLIGQSFQPITNIYTLVLRTNGQAIRQTFQRIVTAPDFLFTAEDLTTGNESYDNPFGFDMTRSIIFDQTQIGTGAGPGLIDPPVTFTYNNVGTIRENVGRAFLNGENAGPAFNLWGSYDGTTNDPVVYPDGTSLDNLQRQMLVQISPASLPNGTTTNFYSATFTADGGGFIQPFTWTLVPNSPSLPPGLTLSPGGILSGTPAQTGSFFFNLQLTDSSPTPLTVAKTYTITIQ